MKNKKKLVKILISIIGVISLLYLSSYIVLGFFHGNFYIDTGVDRTTKDGKVIYVNNETETPYLAKVDEDGNILDVDFKVMCTSDLHLKNDEAYFTLEVLGRFIDKERPDLVVLNGDLIIERTDNVMQEKIKSLFESKNTYFAITLGNHDAQEYEAPVDEARKTYYEKFSSPYLVTYNDETAIDGYGNCAINIKTSETKISQTLFFMDTRKNDYSEKQILWYENKINQIKTENGGEIVKSAVFSHIQLYEYKVAYELSKTDNEECKLLYGNKMEPIDGPDYSNGFFDKMIQLGSTKTYISGHDHNSDLTFMYKGINMFFDQPLSYQSYTRRNFFINLGYLINRRFDYFNDGVNILMFRNDSKMVNIPLYAQHEHVFDGLNKHFRAAKIVYFKNEH